MSEFLSFSLMSRRFLVWVMALVLMSSLSAVAENAGVPEWRQSLRAELARCEKLGFFKGRACTEKARWKYCRQPGRSDIAPEECSNVEPKHSAQPKSTPPWVHALRADLAECDKLGFFKSQGCAQKVRWRHCKNRWDQAPECGGTRPADGEGVGF